MAWMKLPEELLQCDLPYAAVILAAILYDADRNDTYKIRVSQRAIARKMHASDNTVRNSLKRLQEAGIVLKSRNTGDATEIMLKEGVMPPRPQRQSASGTQAASAPKAAPYSTPKSRTVQPLSNSSIDLDAVRRKFSTEA